MTDPYDIANEIVEERLAQLEQWGTQDHPSSFQNHIDPKLAKQADRWKRINAARDNEGKPSWDGILLEEVYEALSEPDPLLRRLELIQVAAVAAAEVEAIDRAVASGTAYGEDDNKLELATPKQIEDFWNDDEESE